MDPLDIPYYTPKIQKEHFRQRSASFYVSSTEVHMVTMDQTSNLQNNETKQRKQTAKTKQLKSQNSKEHNSNCNKTANATNSECYKTANTTKQHLLLRFYGKTSSKLILGRNF